MALLTALLLPLLLLGLLLAMERVEQGLRVDALADQLVEFLRTARPDEVEEFVRNGFAVPVQRYWGV